MPYSKEIESALKKAKIRVGDRVRIGDIEGLLMPRVMGSPDHVIIKLDNGYNAGVRFSKSTALERSKTHEPKRIEEEFEYEVEEEHAKPSKKELCPPGKPPVALLSAGGTIASKIDYRTGGVTATLDAKDIFASIPELQEQVCFAEAVDVCKVLSEDMDHTHWQALAKAAAKSLRKSDGVIITHGTDTMHYTAAALSFMLPGLGKSVVLTGSQRSTDRGSTDAAMNLLCSAITAKSDLAHVGICMHANSSDDYCMFMRGTKVRKMHSSLRSTFRPINDYPLAFVWPEGRVEVTSPRVERRSNAVPKPDTRFEPKVALLKAFPGSDPSILEYCVKQGFRGIVVEGTGFGHVPTQAKKSWIPSIRAAVESGVVVAVASQAMYGSTNMEVYSNLRVLFRESGAIPCGDMLSETAYVKLGWVLGHTKSAEKAGEMMLTNVAGEFNSRLEEDMFLY
ncbi:MAG: Glu-tRNA(Gln) amidotransferase subunit GatD [Candidatus Diapherotrites archaeon]|nr:Glu-tRNA(Gln) amidotransferase subunit GatD [Candidatus Diapherotrites archaeon]